MKSDEHAAALRLAADQFEAEKLAAQNEVHALFQRQEEDHLQEKEVGRLVYHPAQLGFSPPSLSLIDRLIHLLRPRRTMA